MKIVISDTPPYFLDLNAPTLGAEAIEIDGVTIWRVWCRYCQTWHEHGPGDGHRLAHCTIDTPYTQSGYNLVHRPV